MAWKIRPAHFNLRFVRAVRKALLKGEDCCGMATQSYHLFVPVPGTERPELYTVCLVQDDEGTCMAICREVPEVLVFAEGEGDALAAAQTSIEEALAARGSCAELGHVARSSASGGSGALHQLSA